MDINNCLNQVIHGSLSTNHSQSQWHNKCLVP